MKAHRSMARTPKEEEGRNACGGCQIRRHDPRALSELDEGDGQQVSLKLYDNGQRRPKRRGGDTLWRSSVVHLQGLCTKP